MLVYGNKKFYPVFKLDTFFLGRVKKQREKVETVAVKIEKQNIEDKKIYIFILNQLYLVDDCRWLGALEETNRHRVDAHVTYKKYSDQGTTFFLQYPDLVSNTNIVSLALSCCTIFIYSPNLPVLYTVTEAYQICSSLWDLKKGQSYNIFYPIYFHHSNRLGQLTNGLKHCQIWFCFRRDIPTYVSKKLTARNTVSYCARVNKKFNPRTLLKN